MSSLETLFFKVSVSKVWSLGLRLVLAPWSLGKWACLKSRKMGMSRP